jgi:signal transduction histidine kinase
VGQYAEVSLRNRLLVLTLAALVPALVFAAVVVVLLHGKERAAVDRGLADTARALSLAIERELDASITALRVLALSRSLSVGDYRTFHEQALSVLATRQKWTNVYLVEVPSNRQLVNTLRPYGTPLPPSVNRELHETVARTRQPAVSDVFIGSVNGRPVVSVLVPVVRGGEVRHLLGAAILPEVLGGLLAEQQLPGTWLGTLIDGRQRIIARTRSGETLVGQPPSPSLAEKIRVTDEGTFETTTIEGVRVHTAVKRSPFSGWTIALGVPASVVEASLVRSLWTVVAMAAVGLLLGVGFARASGRRIERAVAALVEAARDMGRGRVPALGPLPLPELDEAGRAMVAASLERRQAEDAARTALQRVEFLAETSRRLSGSLDYERTVETVARLAVPVLADVCAFDVVGADGRLEQVVSAQRDPGPPAASLEAWHQAPALDAEHHPVTTALRTARPVFVPDVTDDWLRAAASGPEHLEHLRRLDLRSLVTVPVRGRSRMLGALRCAYTGASGRRHTADDLALVEELARRAAIAMEQAAMYRAAEAARTEAEAANRAKDEFLAVLSHELRTPLNSVYGWTRMLRSGHLADDVVAHALDVIERSVKTQIQLIEDLLDVSRIVTGKMRLEITPVALDTVVDAALDTVRPAMEAKAIGLEYRVDRGAVTVLADAARLQQVAWNLLSNAVKFTPRGGAVRVVLERRGPSVRLAVSDTGQGIDKDALPRIFDRFWQADGSSTRLHGGLGIGLALVRHLVELHGGTVAADSEGEGRGATFTVEVPTAAAREVAVESLAGD